MTVCVPKGYVLAGVHSRIKRDPHKQDLTLVMSETPASAAGVYTQNLVYAAPVAVDRRRTPSDRIQAVVICSGVANACTGERGLRDAKEMARLAAAACAAEPDQALVLSTGVIGAFLPMDRVSQGISAAAGSNLGVPVTWYVVEPCMVIDETSASSKIQLPFGVLITILCTSSICSTCMPSFFIIAFIWRGLMFPGSIFLTTLPYSYPYTVIKCKHLRARNDRCAAGNQTVVFCNDDHLVARADLWIR